MGQPEHLGIWPNIETLEEDLRRQNDGLPDIHEALLSCVASDTETHLKLIMEYREYFDVTSPEPVHVN
jgi:hypothetical protein